MFTCDGVGSLLPKAAGIPLGDGAGRETDYFVRTRGTRDGLWVWPTSQDHGCPEQVRGGTVWKGSGVSCSWMTVEREESKVFPSEQYIQSGRRWGPGPRAMLKALIFVFLKMFGCWTWNKKNSHFLKRLSCNNTKALRFAHRVCCNTVTIKWISQAVLKSLCLPLDFKPGGWSLFWAQSSALQFAGPAPAAGGDAHASLGTLSPLSVAFRLALGPFGAAHLHDGSGGGGLWGDGTQQVIALAQEVVAAAQPETAFPQDHTSTSCLSGSGPLIVLQLWQVRRVTIRDELRQEERERDIRGSKERRVCMNGEKERHRETEKRGMEINIF